MDRCCLLLYAAFGSNILSQPRLRLEIVRPVDSLMLHELISYSRGIQLQTDLHALLLPHHPGATKIQYPRLSATARTVRQGCSISVARADNCWLYLGSKKRSRKFALFSVCAAIVVLRLVRQRMASRTRRSS